MPIVILQLPNVKQENDKKTINIRRNVQIARERPSNAEVRWSGQFGVTAITACKCTATTAAIVAARSATTPKALNKRIRRNGCASWRQSTGCWV